MIDIIAAHRRDERGVATVEFALILPILVLIFVGANYLAEATIVQNKVTRAADALARLASMEQNITDAEIVLFRNVTLTLLEPLPGQATLTLTSVGDTGSGLKVRWSDKWGGSNGVALVPGSAYTFPAGAGAFQTVNAGKNTLVASVSLAHTSFVARLWNALPWAPSSFAEEHVYTDLAYSVPLTYLGSGTDQWTRRTKSGVTVF